MRTLDLVRHPNRLRGRFRFFIELLQPIKRILPALLLLSLIKPVGAAQISLAGKSLDELADIALNDQNYPERREAAELFLQGQGIPLNAQGLSVARAYCTDPLKSVHLF